jgi:large subunit ribosomal protein L15
MSEIGLHTLRPRVPWPREKRVGRGPGSGHGKTSGRGTKGQKARSGGAKGPGFEGGQLPIHKRLPKRGFTNARFRQPWQIVNLQQLKDWPAGEPVTFETLAKRRLVRRNRGPVKLLAKGEVSQPLVIEVDAASQAARAKVEAAGGRVVLRSAPKEAGSEEATG